MSFDEVRFPDAVAMGATGGPRWNTNLVILQTGAEQRNQLWTTPRHAFNVATGIPNIEYYHDVLRFFVARRGRLRGFRFKDWTDCTSATSPAVAITSNDVVIGTGNGPHQLIKVYTDAVFAWTRTIRKPVSGTVRISVNGTETLAGGAFPWSIDTTTGIVTFTGSGGGLPGGGATIRAGFEFDTPCRFDTDVLAAAHTEYNAVAAQSIDIIEVRF
jgi:uncharacterized protein (TIGR02217 family)